MSNGRCPACRKPATSSIDSSTLDDDSNYSDLEVRGTTKTQGRYHYWLSGTWIPESALIHFSTQFSRQSLAWLTKRLNMNFGITIELQTEQIVYHRDALSLSIDWKNIAQLSFNRTRKVV